MSKLTFFFISLEAVLVLIMVIISGRKYNAFANAEKMVWRILLLLPIYMILLPFVFQSNECYKFLLLIGIGIVLVADVAIIYNAVVGLFVFLAFHIINIVNYGYLFRGQSFEYLCLIILFFSLLVWLVIFKLTFKKENIEKFIEDNLDKIPKFFQKNIIIEIVIFGYISSIIISAWCGFLMFFVPNINLLFPVFAVAGAVIFSAGDYFIFFEMFKRKDKPFHQILNNLLYYIPLVLYSMLGVISLKIGG